MDPITQGLLGGIVAQALAKKPVARAALFCGVVGGLSADLDILIRSDSDPLLSIEYHRHFTHSLLFIPIGGVIIGILTYFLLRRKIPFNAALVFSTLGYATHGILDTCTSYGTYLFWPFSSERISWDIIAIIDPLFTGSLLIFVGLSMWKRSSKIARDGFILSMIYLCVGITQNFLATEKMHELAYERGHEVERYRVMPTLGNLLLWRSVYESTDNFYVDAIFTSPFGEDFSRFGGHLPKLDIKRDFPNISSLQERDTKRFRHFANGYVVVHPEKPDIIGDLRYSLLPHKTNPLWGIKIKQSTPDEHITRISFGNDRLKHWNEFIQMVGGNNVIAQEE